MNERPSITTKLFLSFLGLLILALGFLGTISTLWFVRQESTNLDQFLESEAQNVANRIEGIVDGFNIVGRTNRKEVEIAFRLELRDFLSSRLNRPIPYKTTLIILGNEGQILAQSNQALDLQGPLPDLKPGEIQLNDVRGRGPAYRAITAAVSLGPGGQGAFRIACLLTSLDPPLESFLLSLLLVLGGSLVMFSLLGAGLIGRTLRPVRSMAQVASQISEQNLGTRIPRPPGKDDLSRLALTLNGLLARLETDYAFQERLVGELTHQLKTPLTVLRGRNELGMTTLHSVTELQELVEDNLSDIDSLVYLLNTLLELARYDSRIDHLRTVPVDLATLVGQLKEELEPLWLSKDLEFRTAGERLTLEADPEGLRQILTNLYDNAWKFAPPGTPILTRWEVGADQDLVRIIVSNQGPPIVEEDLERIFKRFFRSASGNDSPGSGLGLSIVRSLVELHGGTVKAENPPEGGAAFVIELPYESPTSPTDNRGPTPS